MYQMAKERIADYWNGRAATFDATASHTVHADAWELVLTRAVAELSRPARVLDLGAGTGACALPMARLGHEVTAVDLAETMLAQLRGRAAAEGLVIATVCCDVETFERPEASVDLVTLRNLLWTLPNPDRVLSSVKRMLQPGGTVLIADGFWDHPTDAPQRGPEGEAPSFPHPGADRFLDLYHPIVDQLPLYRGVRTTEIELLLAAHGFVALQHWHGVFKRSPYPTFSDFFVITARRPVDASIPLAV